MKYVALLRGINVGGHHKVPMYELKKEFSNLGFTHISTILNSGNVIFESDFNCEDELMKTISPHIEKVFHFPIPVIIRKSDIILNIINSNPFQNIETTKDIRQYITFLLGNSSGELSTPWSSEDNSFRILEVRDGVIISVLDLALTTSIKGMAILEKHFGKNITTRNWNTIKRIEKLLK